MLLDTERAIVIMIRGNTGGLTVAESRDLSALVRKAVGDDAYSVSVREVVGEQNLWVSSKENRKKEKHLEAIERLQGQMTAAEIAQALGLTERQVYRYKALLKSLSCGPAANDPQ